MRERSSRLLLDLALLLYGLALARANFLYKQEPLVRVSPAVGDSDLFGYAVAFHRVDDTGDRDDFDHAISNTIILVGAPMGTFPGGLNFPGINDSSVVNRTGLVYACPITPGECRSVSGSGVGNDIRLFDYTPNEYTKNEDNDRVQDEEKEGQFMGATIVSSGEHVLVCAPRWISLRTMFLTEFMTSRAQGRCYYSGRNMTNFMLLRPCDNDVSGLSSSGQAYCMAGTSAALDEREVLVYHNSSEGIEINGTQTEFSIYLGAPPAFSSVGSVFKYDSTTNDFGPEIRSGASFQYGGFSVAVGRIVSTDEKDLIYSLPKKNNHTGTVLMYRNSSGDFEISGTQIGEYFGWVVAVADLNGDKYDEVIVGAPLFSTSDNVEKGRIFIYKNDGAGMIDTENPIVINGKVSKGRFGSAIVNLGDINSDGFEDIAVSAPFAKQEDGAEGIVYTYLGSGETVINKEPEDTITASEISKTVGLDSSNTLKSFGYSLSSGVDVDANSYNDLVIGGYKEQAIVVLRAQSIANVTFSLSTNPKDRLLYTDRNCTALNDKFACFLLLINASFSGRGLENRTLETRFNVTEVVDGTPRLFFVDSEDENTELNVYRGTLKFNTTDEIVQRYVKVYVKNDIENRRRDNLNLTVNIYSPTEDQEPREVNGSQNIIDLREIPILEVLPRNNVNYQELSLSGCRNLTCQPDLELTLKEVHYLDEDRNLLEIYDELVVGGVKFVEVVFIYRTLDEDAFNTTLVLDLPSRLLKAPESITTNDSNVGATASCSDHTCSLPSFFFEEVFEATILIPVQDIVGNEPDAIAKFTIMGNDMDMSNNVETLNLSVSARANVSISMFQFTPNVTEYKDINDLTSGTHVSLTLSLISRGPTTIPEAELLFYLPGRTERTGEFYYLYPTTASIECEGLNPDGIPSEQLRQRRRSTPGALEMLYRRMVSEENEPTTIRKRAIAETLDCKKNQSSCAVIKCTVSNFTPPSLRISVEAIVDNRFFLSQSGDFEIYAYTEFTISNDYFEDDLQTRMKRSNKLLVREPQRPEDEPIPIWVYIVSVLVGLIILVLIIILLILIVVYFRKRTKKRIHKEKERRRSLHGAVNVSTRPAVASLDSKPESEGASKPERELDEKPSEDMPDNEDPDETEI